MLIFAITALVVTYYTGGFNKPDVPDLVSMNDQELIDYAKKEKIICIFFRPIPLLPQEK